MNKKIIIYTTAFLLLAALGGSGCAKTASKNDKVLASVGNSRVMLSDLKERIAKLPPYYQNLIEKNKKRFLDETIVETIFYEEAIRKGLDRDREVKEILNEAKKKILIAKLIKNEVEDNVKVSVDDMKRFYDGHKDDFKTEEMWRASHILVGTEQEAKEILDELSKGASFEELAKARSTDATASRGGDIGFFRRGQVVPDFEKECLKLEKGRVSGIVHTQFGYHIIKLTDKKEPATEEFEKVKGSIEELLKKGKRSVLFDEMVANLKKKYGVKIEDDVFTSLEDLKK